LAFSIRATRTTAPAVTSARVPARLAAPRTNAGLPGLAFDHTLGARKPVAQLPFPTGALLRCDFRKNVVQYFVQYLEVLSVASLFSYLKTTTGLQHSVL
jgi:hypothetical protein